MTKNALGLIGLGNQAMAWAQNLSESARDVKIFVRSQNQRALDAQKLGLEVHLLSVQSADLLSQIETYALLIPDHAHADFLKEHAHLFAPKTKFILAHGYTVAFEKIDQSFPQFEFVLLAPKGIASELRRRKLSGENLGAVWSKKQSPQHQDFIESLARDLGITHLYASTFEEECKADLFSEQALLCGVVPYAAQRSFQFLIDKGVSSEVAFMECWMELQLITQALVNKGPEEFFQMISPNALLGSQVAQELIFDQAFDQKLEKLWSAIEDGSFEKKVKESSYKSVQEKVVQQWKKESLQKTYNQLKSIL